MSSAQRQAAGGVLMRHVLENHDGVPSSPGGTSAASFERNRNPALVDPSRLKSL